VAAFDPVVVPRTMTTWLVVSATVPSVRAPSGRVRGTSAPVLEDDGVGSGTAELAPLVGVSCDAPSAVARADA